MVVARRPDRFELEDVDAEICRRDFREFIRAAWPIAVPGAPLIDGYYLDAIADHLTALFSLEIKSLIINMPPRHAKSTLGFVMFPAWVWLTEPSFKFLTASYSWSLAARDSNATRRLITSKWYQQLNLQNGSPIFSLVDLKDITNKKLKDRDDWFENNRGGVRRAVGVGGSATGEGGDLVGVDDPVDPRQADSDVERVKANEWWDHTMSTRGNDPKRTRRLIIQQRLHEDDLTGHVLAKEAGYVNLVLSQRFNPKRRCITHRTDGTELYQDPRSTAGELLCPERYGEEEDAAIRIELGSPGAAAAQLDQDPTPEGGLIFKEDWVKHWPTLPPKFDRVITSWDINAGQETEDGSFVVGQKWGRLGPAVYLLDQFRERCDFDAAEDAFVAMADREPKAVDHIVEKKAAGIALIARLRKARPGVNDVSPTGSKVERARAVTGFWRAGNVLLPQASAPWVGLFLEELLKFPRFRTDDQVDAMSQALSELYLPKPDEVPEDERVRRALALV